MALYGGVGALAAGANMIGGMISGDHPVIMIRMAMLDQQGQQVFRDALGRESEDGIGVGGMNLKYNPERVARGWEEAADEVFRQVEAHMDGKKKAEKKKKKG